MVEIYPEGFRTTPYKQNYDIKIPVSSKMISCNYILTSDCFLLFYKKYELGVFTLYTTPLVLVLSNTQLGGCVNVNMNKAVLFEGDMLDEDGTLEVAGKAIDGSLKLRIIDFKTLVV